MWRRAFSAYVYIYINLHKYIFAKIFNDSNSFTAVLGNGLGHNNSVYALLWWAYYKIVHVVNYYFSSLIYVFSYFR